MAQLNDNFIDFILGAEGGYANDKDDSGGETMHGITWGTFYGHCSEVLKKPPTKEAFLALTKDDVKKFVAIYWDEIGADLFDSQAIAEYVCDWDWGSGKYARYHVQTVLVKLGCDIGRSGVDTIFGMSTIKAINSIEPGKLLGILHEDRIEYYKAIGVGKNAKFETGWENRANRLYNIELNKK